jgi:AraC family transcriptional regulator
MNDHLREVRYAGDLLTCHKAFPPKFRPYLLDDPFALRAIDHIEQNLSVSLTLDDIAAIAGLSPFHFHRRFAESTGETIGDYVRTARLNLAASLIARSKTSILEAALRTGYGSQAAFTRAFAKHFGMTPSGLRAAVRERAPKTTRFHHDLAAATASAWRSEIPLVGMRFHGSYAQVQAHWRHFARTLQNSGFDLTHAQPVGILYDDPGFTPADHIRYDCCVMDQGWSDHLVQPPVRRLTLRPSGYAQLQVTGSYNLISEAILSVCALWLSRHRSILGNGPAYEIHSTPPWDDSGCFSATVLVPIT